MFKALAFVGVIGGVGVAVVGGTVNAVRGAVIAAFWSASDCKFKMDHYEN